MTHGDRIFGLPSAMRSPLPEFLLPDAYAVPGIGRLLQEARLVEEAGRAVLRRGVDLRRCSTDDAGEGQPVLLIPGFLAGDWTLVELSRQLRRHGWRTYRSGIHANVSCTLRTGNMLESRLQSLADLHGTRVRIVGHSLGGMLARGLAVRRPDLVSGIVTMGSPMLAPAAHHPLLTGGVEVLLLLSRLGIPQVMAHDCVAGNCARDGFIEMRSMLTPDVAFTSIYSRRDGIIDYHAALDPQAEWVEVACSHIGMAFDPRCCDAVLEALERQRDAEEPSALAG
jgi:triacylglycerol lipase